MTTSHLHAVCPLTAALVNSSNSEAYGSSARHFDVPCCFYKHNFIRDDVMAWVCWDVLKLPVVDCWSIELYTANMHNNSNISSYGFYFGVTPIQYRPQIISSQSFQVTSIPVELYPIDIIRFVDKNWLCKCTDHSNWSLIVDGNATHRWLRRHFDGEMANSHFVAWMSSSLPKL